MDSWTEESHAGDDLGFEFETLKLIGFLLCLAIGTIVAVTYQCLAVADQRRMRNNNNTQQQQNEQQPQGLQINRQLIPVVEYSKESKDGICAVCLCEFKVGEAIRVLPECMHLFHAGCIDMCLSSHSNCPLCRTDIEPRHVVLLVPQFRGGNLSI
ncbi:hypothetical protein PRUPE_6G252800 [Prunus persica]|uniref:RING-type domain-containing protein n=1 Tax=Prunus persica TaxID=3760 RepID=A0A251NVN5_PRUPE|nr:RING-H2 finger protein ATL80 [Prunus persica]ONI03357.1 hypothetical protein PRUPE_6G252800 [Prunus persica]